MTETSVMLTLKFGYTMNPFLFELKIEKFSTGCQCFFYANIPIFLEPVLNNGIMPPQQSMAE